MAFDPFIRFATPDPAAPTDPVSGSYLRLGQYRADENSYLPVVGSDDTASMNASDLAGIILKTDGKLLMTVDDEAYLQFKSATRMAVDSTFVLDVASSIAATSSSLSAKTESGDLSLESATNVMIEAKNGNVEITATGDLVQNVSQDAWTQYDGEWKSLAHGRAWSYFGGVKIDFFAGMAMKFVGALSISVSTLDVKIKAIGDVTLSTLFTFKATVLDFKTVKIDGKTCAVELKNGVATVHKNFLKYKKEEVSVDDDSIQWTINPLHADSHTLRVSQASAAALDM